MLPATRARSSAWYLEADRDGESDHVVLEVAVGEVVVGARSEVQLPLDVVALDVVVQAEVVAGDAIGGVVNIITHQNYDGFRFDAQTGSYLSEGDGEDTQLSALWGGGNDTTRFLVSASWKDEGGIETADRERSAFPNPNATSCDVPGTFCSSFTPQGRFILGPNFDFASITLNDGVLNDGGANIPNFDPNNPASGDFHG